MNISKWPKNEKPREKLILKGAEALSDAVETEQMNGKG